MKLPLIAIITFILSGLDLGFVLASECQLRSDRPQIYISDTHMGMGGKCEDTESCVRGWHPMEDFRWSSDFSLFSDYLNQKYKNGFDLVVVGDMLELWQRQSDEVEPCGISGESNNLGCNANQALARVKIIANAHQDIIKTIESFIDEGSNNKLIVVPGNHDAALMMNDVRLGFLNQFRSSPRKNICIQSSGILRLDRDTQSILLEHGHQIEGDPNRYTNPVPPLNSVQCLNSKGKPSDCNAENAYIMRTWGENFVQSYFDDYEKQFSIIDNYSFEPSGIPDGVKRGLSSATLIEKKSAITGLFAFLFAKQTAKQFKGVMGNAEGKSLAGFCSKQLVLTADQICLDRNTLNSSRATQSFIKELPEEMRSTFDYLMNVFGMEPSGEWLISDLYKTANDHAGVIDQTFLLICDYWRAKDTSQNSCHFIDKDGKLGGLFSKVKYGFLESVTGKEKLKLFNHIKKRFSEAGTSAKETKIFIYGHTHKAERGTFTDHNTHFFNTGAWQRVASAEVIAEILRNCPLKDEAGVRLSEKQCFKAISPNELPKCYSFVEHDIGNRLPELTWWFYSEFDEQWVAVDHDDRPDFCR